MYEFLISLRPNWLCFHLISLSLVVVLIGCASSERDDSEMVYKDVASSIEDFSIGAGDVIKLITIGRSRFQFRVMETQENGFVGVTLDSKQSSVESGLVIYVPYEDIVLLQTVNAVDHKINQDKRATQRAVKTVAVVETVESDVRFRRPNFEIYNEQMQLPNFRIYEMLLQTDTCESLDVSLRKVDAIRWSIRQDGVDLDTNFERIRTNSLAWAAIIGLSVAVMHPIPAAPYTDADRLENADAIIISLLKAREEMDCVAHPHCDALDGSNTVFHQIQGINKEVEDNNLKESDGLEKLTQMLDQLCPSSPPAIVWNTGHK